MMIDDLLDKTLIFVTGKGGVGKSTCTAALAESLSREGRRVLVVETDSYSVMGDLIGSDRKEVDEVRIHENLWAVNLRAAECLVHSLTRFLPSERIVRTMTQNRVTEAFFRSAPSVNEFVLLDRIMSYVEGSDTRFDHVIVDLPASGHAVTFLGVPDTLHRMMRGLGPIAKRARLVGDRIASRRDTAIVGICLPEEMPVNETIELEGNLEENLGRGLDLVMVNMVHRAPLDAAERKAFETIRESLGAVEDPAEVLAHREGGVIRLIAGNQLALDWYDRDRHYLDVLHEQLDARVLEVPMFYEVEDREIVEKLASFLRDGEQAENLAS